MPAPRRLQPSASYSFTMRIHLPIDGDAFAEVARALTRLQIDTGARPASARQRRYRGRASADPDARDAVAVEEQQAPAGGPPRVLQSPNSAACRRPLRRCPPDCRILTFC
jgi:hypothetical protein